VDCGTDRVLGRALVERATHILWTVPATPVAVAAGRVLFESGVLPPPGRAREALVAVARDVQPAVRVRTLRHVAQPRCERVALIPHAPSLANGEPPLEVDEGVRRAPVGIASTLRRTP
jgi:hypothetical protein